MNTTETITALADLVQESADKGWTLVATLTPKQGDAVTVYQAPKDFMKQLPIEMEKLLRICRDLRVHVVAIDEDGHEFGGLKFDTNPNN